MSRHFTRFSVSSMVLAGLFLLAPAASAQLKLPKNKVKDSSAGKSQPTIKDKGNGTDARNGIIPHLVCSECGTHNYTSKMNRPQPDGSYTAACLKCGSDKPHLRSVLADAKNRVKLPSGEPTRLPTPPTGSGLQQVGGLSSADLRYGDTAAGFIFREVASNPQVRLSLVEKAIESLLGLGEQGLVTSRIVLHDTSSSAVLVAGSVLIRAGSPEDSERVVARLQTNLPGKSGVGLLDELVERNPVYGSPALLIGLLDHPQKPVRTRSASLLSKRVGPESLPQLKQILLSKRSDTRLSAMKLIAEVDDPEVLNVLFEHLNDRSSRVANFVIESLAAHTGQSVDLELLSRALPSKWILRENAFALLAIIEREDDQLRAILDDRHAELLLGGLRSRDALVHGSCAAALAGIGYRSSQPLDTSWLDLEVTGTMVTAISGKEFHTDFTVMQPRVLRRLRLLTGENFGTNGPEWARWWVSNRSGFYAHRAFLKVPKDGESTLEVHFRGPSRDGGVFSLLGADAWTKEGEARAGAAEKLILTRRECLDLLSLLEKQGTLGPDVPPGLRGTRGRGQRELELVINGHGKIFVFGNGRTEPWFDTLTSAMRNLQHRNRWQRFRTTQFADSKDFWETESGWWAGEHGELERSLRLKDLIFGSMKRLPPSQRSLALAELSRIYEVDGAATRADFDFLMDLLRDEGFYAARAEELVALSVISASIGPDGQAGALDKDLGTKLIDLLIARFARNAIPAMGDIAQAIGRDYVRELAIGENMVLRAVAAGKLAQDPTAEDQQLLIEMLNDPSVVVESAAVSALGVARVEEARTELLLRARLGVPMVRAAALKSIGLLRGEYVLEALVLGVSDADQEIKRGAAEGLVALQDPQSAALLISLLRQGRDSEIFHTARQGLIELGEQAGPELRRVVNSPAHGARRECALLLSRMGDPEVVLALIDLLGKQPDDQDVAFELAVLSCVDHRGDLDPSANWLTWFEGVTHGDSLNWLLAAIERSGIPLPPGASFSGGVGTREGALILHELLESDEDYLSERALRELGRLLGGDLGVLPNAPIDRAAWLSALRETILKRFDA